MSSIVSRRPSFRNHWNEAFWISIRFGSSRTCSTREKDVRARGAATLAVKRYSPPLKRRTDQRNLGQAKTTNVGATCKGTKGGGGGEGGPRGAPLPPAWWRAPGKREAGGAPALVSPATSQKAKPVRKGRPSPPDRIRAQRIRSRL